MPLMAHTEGATERYWERFTRIKRAKGLSWTQLVRAAEKASTSTFRAFAAEPPEDGSPGRWRYPTAATIADVARALGVEPEEFPEYRLAMAREMLDERVVGLDQALATLTQFETALQERAARRSATSRERASRSRQPKRENQNAASSPQEARTHGSSAT